MEKKEKKQKKQQKTKHVPVYLSKIYNLTFFFFFLNFRARIVFLINFSATFCFLNCSGSAHLVNKKSFVGAQPFPARL